MNVRGSPVRRARRKHSPRSHGRDLRRDLQDPVQEQHGPTSILERRRIGNGNSPVLLTDSISVDRDGATHVLLSDTVDPSLSLAPQQRSLSEGTASDITLGNGSVDVGIDQGLELTPAH